MNHQFTKAVIILILLLSNYSAVTAQIIPYASSEDSIYFATTKYRLIGPFRGGRAATACGSLVHKNTFYMGTTGGGVWRTKDAGASWENISDKYFGGSIGSVALAPSDENIIYVGEGENTMRGNVSEGINGIWKSTNGGRTWKNMGLSFARHITNIVVHPRNPDIVWACVFGPLFGEDNRRGVYKSVDGGVNWKRILASDDPHTGAIEICIEPNNPDVIYASLWQMKRTPYSMESGGTKGGIFKSMDGGNTWKNITRSRGLPKDSLIGISYIAIAPSNPDRVYALVESKEGGLFMSDDAGATWTLQNSESNIRQRAWYFSKMAVDPQNQDKIWICNVELFKSTNAGKTLQSVSTPHVDHHNIWIDPHDPQRMIISDDGGAQVSMDGGVHWSTYYNQPTAQIYRISADNAYPYRLLGGQQDNSSVRIPSNTAHGYISNNDFSWTAGGEAGVDVADPLNPDIVYGGEYAGILRRMNHQTGELRYINVWPESNIGSGAENLKYRFQWNYPLFFSVHRPNRLYAAGNCLFYSENEGLSWVKISGDLTTNNKDYQKPSGGPITKDNTTVEYYCTIFSVAESPFDAKKIMTGSDDGLIHITTDGGSTWKNVTPKQAGKLMLWNCLEADPFDQNTFYAIGTKYKLNDYTPYLYKTSNNGQTWQLITNGIPSQHFTRVLRCDKKRKDLLYCGTEYGMYISYDGGASWKKFQLNLPIVPITDMCIQHNDLCIATQGRSIWVLDDLTLVQQYGKRDKNRVEFFPINETIKYEGSVPRKVENSGLGRANGVVMNYYLPADKEQSKVKIIIQDEFQKQIDIFTTEGEEDKKLKPNVGMNQWVWNMYYPALDDIKDMVLWNGPIRRGPHAIPGKYSALLIVDKDTLSRAFNILPNPTYKITIADYRSQFNFLNDVKTEFESVQRTIKNIRKIKSQITACKKLSDTAAHKNIITLCDSINKKLTVIEEALYQTKAKSGQDVLNYPIKLNDKLASLYNQGNDGYSAATEQSKEVFQELKAQCMVQKNAFQSLLDQEVVLLNQLIKQSTQPIIGIGRDE